MDDTGATCIDAATHIVSTTHALENIRMVSHADIAVSRRFSVQPATTKTLVFVCAAKEEARDLSVSTHAHESIPITDVSLQTTTDNIDVSALLDSARHPSSPEQDITKEVIVPEPSLENRHTRDESLSKIQRTHFLPSIYETKHAKYDDASFERLLGLCRRGQAMVASLLQSRQELTEEYDTAVSTYQREIVALKEENEILKAHQREKDSAMATMAKELERVKRQVEEIKTESEARRQALIKMQQPPPQQPSPTPQAHIPSPPAHAGDVESASPGSGGFTPPGSPLTLKKRPRSTSVVGTALKLVRPTTTTSPSDPNPAQSSVQQPSVSIQAATPATTSTPLVATPAMNVTNSVNGPGSGGTLSCVRRLSHASVQFFFTGSETLQQEQGVANANAQDMADKRLRRSVSLASGDTAGEGEGAKGEKSPRLVGEGGEKSPREKRADSLKAQGDQKAVKVSFGGEGEKEKETMSAPQSPSGGGGGEGRSQADKAKARKRGASLSMFSLKGAKGSSDS